jgi:hypothetical protein
MPLRVKASPILHSTVIGANALSATAEFQPPLIKIINNVEMKNPEAYV